MATPTQCTLAMVDSVPSGTAPAGMTYATLTGANFTGSNWAHGTDLSIWNASTGGGFYQSNGNTDVLTYALPPGTIAVYLIAFPKQGDSVGAAGRVNHPLIQVQIDNVNYGPLINLAIDSPIHVMQYYDCAIPLVRSGASVLSGNGHTLKVIVSNAALGFVAVEGILTIQAKATVTKNGLYAAIGDSWTRFGGSSSLYQAYTYKVSNILQDALNRPISYANYGQDGDMMVGSGGYNATGPVLPKTGGMYKIINDLFPAPAEFASYAYFTNDLSVAALGWYLKTLRWSLCLLEDGIDMSGRVMKCAVPTPGWHAPAAMVPSRPLVLDPTVVGQTDRYYSGRFDGIEVATAMAQAVFARHPWALPVDLTAAMDGRSSFLYPNTSNPVDVGNHPNDQGTAAIAEAVSTVLLEY